MCSTIVVPVENLKDVTEELGKRCTWEGAVSSKVSEQRWPGRLSWPEVSLPPCAVSVADTDAAGWVDPRADSRCRFSFLSSLSSSG